MDQDTVDPDEYTRVARLDELREGQGKLVFVGAKKLALFLVDGQTHCIQNFCPHAGGYLAAGEVSGCVVKCPRHSWGFDVTTGKCLTNKRYEARTYPTRVDEEGWVLVAVDEDLW